MDWMKVDGPITVGALRRALAGLPEDWLVVVDDERHGASWTVEAMSLPWRLSRNADGSQDYWRDDSDSRADYGELGSPTAFDDLPMGVVVFPQHF